MPNLSKQITRLAPSPTGALHLGNARTFLITWAIARQRGWGLILRIEDLDTPRIKPGAAEAITDILSWLGMEWDPGPILVQSLDLSPYRRAMTHLAAHRRAYPCDLTRTEIEAAASAPQEGAHETCFPLHLRPVVSATDFEALEQASQARAAHGKDEGTNWRFVVEPGPIPVFDQFSGDHSFDLSRLVGDFVIWTRRRQPSYQLAVVVDDHRQGVTQVIRGDDLLDSAARQLLLYRALGYENEPGYTHLPLVLGPDGKRLAKRHGDTRVDTYRAMGVPPEAVLGLVASWSIPGQARRLVSPREFLDSFDLTKMSHDPIHFTPEDDRWLRSQVRRG